MRTIATPFRFSATGGVATTDDINQIAYQQILDVVVTATGERTMRPRYGAGVAAELFEPLDPMRSADVATVIQQTCLELLTLAVVQRVRVAPYEAGSYALDLPINTLLVEVQFTIPPDDSLRTATYQVRGTLTEEG